MRKHFVHLVLFFILVAGWETRLRNFEAEKTNHL